MVISLWLTSQCAALTLLVAASAAQPTSMGQVFLFAAFGALTLVALLASLACLRKAARSLEPRGVLRRSSRRVPRTFRIAADPGVPGSPHPRAPSRFVLAIG